MAFLLRLIGDGVDGNDVTGDDADILGTGECDGGEVRGGGWMSTAFPPGMINGVGTVLNCKGDGAVLY